MAVLDAALATGEARRAAFGLTESQRAREAADDGERAALLAVCEFPRATIEDVRAKGARYLREQAFDAMVLGSLPGLALGRLPHNQRGPERTGPSSSALVIEDRRRIRCAG